MKTLLMIFCLAICILAAYQFEPEKIVYSRSWSFADPLLAILALVCILQLGTGRWRIDQCAAIQLASVAILGVTALVNSAWNNGTLLNSARMACASALLYITMRNITGDLRDLRRFSGLCLMTGLVVYAISIPKFLTTWSADFTNYFFVFGFENLNDFGFLFVMVFCASAPFWLRDRNIIRGFFAAALLASGALISLSRSAWTTLGIAALICASVRDVKSKRARIIRLLAVGAGFIAAAYVFSLMVARLPEAQQFGEKKLAGYGEDAVDTRLIDLTLTPFLEWLREPPSTWIFGDAVSDHHTFFANAIWSTGIFGLAAGLALYISMARTAIHAWRLRSNSLKEYKLAGACYAALVLVTFLDDSATNIRYHSQVVTYLFYASAGAFAGFLRGAVSGRVVRRIAVAPGAANAVNPAHAYGSARVLDNC